VTAISVFCRRCGARPGLHQRRAALADNSQCPRCKNQSGRPRSLGVARVGSPRRRGMLAEVGCDLLPFDSRLLDPGEAVIRGVRANGLSEVRFYTR
jgi:hypothetical protein